MEEDDEELPLGLIVENLSTLTPAKQETTSPFNLPTNTTLKKYKENLKQTIISPHNVNLILKDNNTNKKEQKRQQNT